MVLSEQEPTISFGIGDGTDNIIGTAQLGSGLGYRCICRAGFHGENCTEGMFILNRIEPFLYYL